MEKGDVNHIILVKDEKRFYRERAGDVAICVVLLQSADDAQSLHAVSFLRLHGDRIVQIDEYWSDDGPVPPWRKALLGRVNGEK